MQRRKTYLLSSGRNLSDDLIPASRGKKEEKGDPCLKLRSAMKGGKFSLVARVRSVMKEEIPPLLQVRIWPSITSSSGET
jgi:hypothetical protein